MSLFAGKSSKIAPERAWHNRMKLEVALALRQAIQRAAFPECTAYTDGMTIKIDNHTAREPDALVQCKPIPLNEVIADEPVIVVEVASPSSEKTDVAAKMTDYFSVPSIQHYLIVTTESVLLHHARQSDDQILTRNIRDGDVHLDPPGLTLSFDELVPRF